MGRHLDYKHFSRLGKSYPQKRLVREKNTLAYFARGYVGKKRILNVESRCRFYHEKCFLFTDVLGKKFKELFSWQP